VELARLLGPERVGVGGGPLAQPLQLGRADPCLRCERRRRREDPVLLQDRLNVRHTPSPPRPKVRDDSRQERHEHHDEDHLLDVLVDVRTTPPRK